MSSIGCVQNDFRANGMFGANRAPISHRQWLPTDRNEIPLDPCHLESPSGASKMISEPMVRSAQTVHLSCVKTSTISQKTKMSLHLPSGASKMVSEPMVRLAQTVHLSCPDTNTVPKCTESRLHSSHITLDYHQVRPKRFLSLWYVRHKPCS